MEGVKRSLTPMERRRDDVVLCRARIGHAYFANVYLLRGELRPMCCNTPLTVRHALLSCAKYTHIRRKDFSLISLFERFRDTPAGFIIQFRECNLYYICQGERTKFDRFVDPNVRGAAYCIYESIVIEFFLRLEIHNKGTCVPRFDIENLIFIVSMVNYETLAMQCHAEIFILSATRPI